MGDRANVYMKDGDRGVYLYTHWEGSELPFMVQKALAHKQRWDDGQYLTRIIFQEMLGDDTEYTGFGIGARMCDNGHKIIVVDSHAGKIGFVAEGKETSPISDTDGCWNFSDYIALSETDIIEAYEKKD